MRMKKTQKFVTFETTPEIWLALKVASYKQGKSVKEYLNEILIGILPAKEVTKEEVEKTNE